MEISAILSLLPGPIVVVALYLLLRYKYSNGNFYLIYKTFIIGLAGIIPVFIIDRLVSYFHLDHLHSLNRTVFYAFVLTGGVFELWKFLVLRLYVYPNKQVTKTFDVILYSIIIAAGFTVGYSVYALFYPPIYINMSYFAFTSGPVFVSIAVIMGYFTGIALNRQFPVIDFITGLFIAVVFQGMYRFCLLTNDRLLLYLAIGGMLITAVSLLFISLREPAKSN
ncbi:MAG: PrsW family glutamic-type intramembrane protease [Bacteroidales bacterium]|nr:PrsW family glutamic-type intramembrane protease [Bacteroidales bacterium]